MTNTCGPSSIFTTDDSILHLAIILSNTTVSECPLSLSNNYMSIVNNFKIQKFTSLLVDLLTFISHSYYQHTFRGIFVFNTTKSTSVMVGIRSVIAKNNDGDHYNTLYVWTRCIAAGEASLVAESLFMVSTTTLDHSWCKDIHSTREWQQVSN